MVHRWVLETYEIKLFYWTQDQAQIVDGHEGRISEIIFPPLRRIYVDIWNFFINLWVIAWERYLCRRWELQIFQCETDDFEKFQTHNFFLNLSLKTRELGGASQEKTDIFRQHYEILWDKMHFYSIFFLYTIFTLHVVDYCWLSHEIRVFCFPKFP